VTGQWFSPGILVSSSNKTDCHNITEILLKVASNTINPNPEPLEVISILGKGGHLGCRARSLKIIDSPGKK
jgi:hypothetical protein